MSQISNDTIMRIASCIADTNQALATEEQYVTSVSNHLKEKNILLEKCMSEVTHNGSIVDLLSDQIIQTDASCSVLDESISQSRAQIIQLNEQFAKIQNNERQLNARMNNTLTKHRQMIENMKIKRPEWIRKIEAKSKLQKLKTEKEVIYKEVSAMRNNHLSDWDKCKKILVEVCKEKQKFELSKKAYEELQVKLQQKRNMERDAKLKARENACNRVDRVNNIPDHQNNQQMTNIAVHSTQEPRRSLNNYNVKTSSPYFSQTRKDYVNKRSNYSTDILNKPLMLNFPKLSFTGMSTRTKSSLNANEYVNQPTTPAVTLTNELNAISAPSSNSRITNVNLADGNIQPQHSSPNALFTSSLSTATSAAKQEDLKNKNLSNNPSTSTFVDNNLKKSSMNEMLRIINSFANNVDLSVNANQMMSTANNKDNSANINRMMNLADNNTENSANTNRIMKLAANNMDGSSNSKRMVNIAANNMDGSANINRMMNLAAHHTEGSPNASRMMNEVSNNAEGSENSNNMMNLAANTKWDSANANRIMNPVPSNTVVSANGNSIENLASNDMDISENTNRTMNLQANNKDGYVNANRMINQPANAMDGSANVNKIMNEVANNMGGSANANRIINPSDNIKMVSTFASKLLISSDSNNSNSIDDTINKHASKMNTSKATNEISHLHDAMGINNMQSLQHETNELSNNIHSWQTDNEIIEENANTEKELQPSPALEGSQGFSIHGSTESLSNTQEDIKSNALTLDNNEVIGHSSSSSSDVSSMVDRTAISDEETFSSMTVEYPNSRNHSKESITLGEKENDISDNDITDGSSLLQNSNTVATPKGKETVIPKQNQNPKNTSLISDLNDCSSHQIVSPDFHLSFNTFENTPEAHSGQALSLFDSPEILRKQPEKDSSPLLNFSLFGAAETSSSSNNFDFSFGADSFSSPSGTSRNILSLFGSPPPSTSSSSSTEQLSQTKFSLF